MNPLPVFTSWEGRLHPFNQLCRESIQRVYGARHVPLDPESLPRWIELPDLIRHTHNVIHRSDYIRSALLNQYGGWWFDCDILLLRDPAESIRRPDFPKIWNNPLDHSVFQRRGVCAGTLYAPHSPWMAAILAEFQALQTVPTEWTAGQDIIAKHTYATDQVEIGAETELFLDWAQWGWISYWNGDLKLEQVGYGVHYINLHDIDLEDAELAPPALVQQYRSAQTPPQLIAAFQSLLAQYLNTLPD